MTVNVASTCALLPDASVTVIVTVFAPRPTLVPTMGDCVITSALVAVQLSLAMTDEVKFGTVAVQFCRAELESAAV